MSLYGLEEQPYKCYIPGNASQWLFQWLSAAALKISVGFLWLLQPIFIIPQQFYIVATIKIYSTRNIILVNILAFGGTAGLGKHRLNGDSLLRWFKMELKKMVWCPTKTLSVRKNSCCPYLSENVQLTYNVFQGAGQMRGGASICWLSLDLRERLGDVLSECMPGGRGTGAAGLSGGICVVIW